MAIERRAIDRRTFALGGLALLASNAVSAAGRVELNLIAATTRTADGGHDAVIYDIDIGPLKTVALPGRGHDIAVNPETRECVAFARRPGTYAVAFGIAREHEPVVFEAPAGRHFYGHGVFSRDGRRLYTTENDYGRAIGVIGVWDVPGRYRRIGELPSHGIGPHDINLLSDGRTLVIANGGIITHPDHGRRPLNLATMTPSLVYLDSANGDLLERHDLERDQHKVSIRHLDVGAGDKVVIGCQFKGPRHEPANLVGFHRRGGDIAMMPATPLMQRALRHYVSSIAIDPGGTIAGITSSRGQHVVMIDIASQQVVSAHPIADVSGIAPGTGPGMMVATNGEGQVAAVVPDQAPEMRRTAEWAWDNHAVRLPG